MVVDSEYDHDVGHDERPPVAALEVESLISRSEYVVAVAEPDAHDVDEVGPYVKVPHRFHGGTVAERVAIVVVVDGRHGSVQCLGVHDG